MRIRRIIPDNTAIYHCMSRTVNGAPFFDSREKEMLRKMIRQVADFSGVEVLTYCIMNNHFHVLVQVPPVGDLSDAELLRRYQVLYPKPNKYQTTTLAGVARDLAAEGETREKIRSQLLVRMGDVSQFMKTLKQRFSVWFNKSQDRFGPVWSDRFKSVLVEDKGFALQTMAAYIDLNPVRAGLVGDPKDYRFCGYSEAVAGIQAAIEGIRKVTPDQRILSPKEAMQSYRQLLFGKGSSGAEGSGQISRADALRVLEKEDGVLPMYALLRCRIRYFTDGAILGSNEFVQSHLSAWQKMRRRKTTPAPQAVAGMKDDLSFINGRSKNAFT